MTISTIYLSNTVVDLLYSILALSLFFFIWWTYKEASGGRKKFLVLSIVTGLLVCMFTFLYLGLSLSSKIGVVDSVTTNRYLSGSTLRKDGNHYIIEQSNGIEFRVKREEVKKRNSNIFLVYDSNFEWKGNLVEDTGDLFFKDCVKEFNLFGVRVCSYYNEVLLTGSNYEKLKQGKTVTFE